MAARQPSASFADRDASRSHGSMMAERDEGTRWPAARTSPEHQRAGSPRGVAAGSHRIRDSCQGRRGRATAISGYSAAATPRMLVNVAGRVETQDSVLYGGPTGNEKSLS